MSDLPIQAINLEAFEKAVYLRDGSHESWESIMAELYGIFRQLRQGSGFFVEEAYQEHLYTRLAGAITSFFTDPKCAFSPDGFISLCANHAILHAIFRASAYETMDHILACLGTRDEKNKEEVNFAGDHQVMKLLACWSLDSACEIPFEVISRNAPQLAAAAMVGMLSVGGSHTPKSYERRLMLMRQRDLIDAAPLHAALIQSAGDCYMHCSYTDAPDKHEIKRVLNRKVAEAVMSVLPVEECTRRLVRKERPTIVIPLEWFGNNHAMYRCYAPSILQLRERFRVVAVFRDNEEVNEEGQKVFDKCVKLGKDEASIAAVLRAIQDQEPDIIYYPSLGMAAWYVALSNFRLAPVQVISPGHPATSMSAAIDYIVSDGDLFGDASDYSEKLVPLPVGTVRYVPREETMMPHVKPKDDGAVRCAIPAMATKLIPPFLETLQEIEKAYGRTLEFHFFPNMTGMSHHVITKDLRRWFPKAIVHPRTTYEQYQAWLAECDVMLSTFPFGGTNSIIDCFLLGIPVITWEGPHVHGRSDASMMRRVGLPEWCIAHTREEYVLAALGILRDEVEREALRLHLRNYDVAGEFFGDGPESVRGGFLAAFENIYEQELQKEGR